MAVRELSLPEWLELVKENEFLCVPDWRFPTQALLHEFLAAIGDPSELEFKNVLRRLLMRSGSLGGDDRLETLGAESAETRPTCSPYAQERGMSELVRRFFVERYPWEGITWILDLLPLFPRRALNALEAYDLAHAQYLPDERLHGLYEAGLLIKARYINRESEADTALATLRDMSWRTFEALVALAYKRAGFEVRLGPGQKDGGLDSIGVRQVESGHERVLIQAKQGRVTVGDVRELSGVLSSRGANRGVLVSPAGLTKPAKAEVERYYRQVQYLELKPLVAFLNENLGPLWLQEIPYLERQGLLLEDTELSTNELETWT